MELYEVVEVCPDCEAENTLQWNVEEMGFVARCAECGEKMMLCMACHDRHIYDGDPDCDWCDDAGGVCYRDNTPITLTTYGHYEEKGDTQYILNFEVPKNWLLKYVKANGYKTIDELLGTYTWDTTMDTYARALEDKVIINEWEV